VTTNLGNLSRPLASFDHQLAQLRMAILTMALQSYGGADGLRPGVTTKEILERAEEIESWVRKP
jgi:hypothetical protein